MGRISATVNHRGRFFRRRCRIPDRAARPGLCAEAKGRFQAEIAVDRQIWDDLHTETGVRPGAHQLRWVFPEIPGKGNNPRIVYLTDLALEITRRLVLKHPEGPLFRNTRGRRRPTDAVNCHFQRLQKKLGTKYCLYVIRHTWMNRLLTGGTDSLTVAVLAGHRPW